MLRLSCDSICHVLASILNISIQECVFPDCWKTAIVVRVHKKGDIYDMHNYRPISLLNLFSKVFEKIICPQVSDYLEELSKLSLAQHGFRKHWSCATFLTRLINLLFTARHAKRHTVLATINFLYAIDCMSFSHLLNALMSHSFADQSVCWFFSYLQGLKQRTKCFNVVSLALSINFGVPEGSILGSMIFNIFIDSLQQSLPLDRTVAYADDITLVSHGDSLRSASAAIQLLLQSVSNWADGHCMFISTEKFFVMYISAVL